MSSTRGRSGSSVSNFGLQDFGALTAADLRNDAAIRLVTPNGSEHLTGVAPSHDDADHRSQVVDGARAPAHAAVALDVSRHVPALQPDGAAHASGNGHIADLDTQSGEHFAFIDHSQPLIAIADYQAVSLPVDHDTSFAPAPITFASFDQIDITHGSDMHSRQGDFGGGTTGGGAHSDAPPPVGAVAGELWAAYGGPGAGGGNPDGHTDFRVEHADSDNESNNSSVIQQQGPSGGEYAAIGLDTSANLTITLDGESNGFHLHVTNLATGVDLSSTVIASVSDQDTVNAFAVDAVNNVIYMDLDGYDYHTDGGDLIKITYNQSTGAINNPYTWNDVTKTGSVNPNGILIDSTSTGGVYQDGRAFALSHDGSTLYYVDDDDNNGIGTVWTAATNGIYKVSTSGDVGHGTAPTPVELSSNANTVGGFPVNDSNGYISGLALNEAQGIIYFTTNSTAEGVNTSQNAMWWMPITGGTATKMTIPGGVAFDFPVFFGEGIAFDIKSRDLYYSDKQTGEIIQFVLSADGHSFASASNFALFDSSSGTDGGFANQLVFDDLPTLGALSATSTEALQGGSALNLLTALPSISDTDNVDLNHMTVQITNAQSGDNLFMNGQQSGTFSGVTVSWNSSTHTLTLSGDVSFATYQTLIEEISYQDSGTDGSSGSHPTRTLTWIISDGVTDVHASTSDSNEQTTTVVIDRAPTLAADNYSVIESASSTGTAGTGGTGVFHNDSDLDADAITVTAVNGSGANVGAFTAGTYGHLQLFADGHYTYNADITANIDGAAFGSHPVDTFTYTVSDGLGGVTTTTVSFTIDRAPTVTADNPAGEALESGSAITGNVLTNDTDHDGDAIHVSAVNGGSGNVNNSIAGAYGHMTIHTDGTYSYTADNIAAIDGAATGSHLTDTFTYTAADPSGATTTTSITVTIDRAPTVVSDSSTSDAVESGTNATGNVLTNDSDRDGDTLVVSAVNGGSGNVNNSVAGTYGHIVIHADGSYTYSADNTVAINGAATGSHLTDTFTYTASDGFGGFTSTSVTITLDRAPTVVNDTNATAESGSLNVLAASGVLANDSDRDGDSLTVLSVSGSSGNVNNSVATTYGHIQINSDGSYSYTADNTAAIDGAANGSHPIDTITFVVSDGFGGLTTETLSITLDRPAVANADTINTNEPGPAQSGSGGNPNLLANDVDKDGDAMTIIAVNGNAGSVGHQITTADGALVTVNADGSYTYDTNHVFDYLAAVGSGASDTTATDTFTYTIDGGSTVTVTITISGVDSNDTLIGTAGADNINGGNGDNIFYDDDGQMSGSDPHDTSAGHSGGADTLIGGSGIDTFYMGANMTAAVSIDGGGGTSDRVLLDGNYSAGLTFGATTMVNVEFLALAGGDSYRLITNDATVGAGQMLTVQGGLLGAGDSLYFDGSAETDGRFTIQGGAGDDTMFGGAGNDIFRPGAGTDTVHGGGGNDSVNFGANFTAADSVDGGSGTDELFLNGNYASALVFTATTMINVEAIGLAAGNSYNLVMNNATVAAGQTLNVRAGTLLAGDALTFDGSADTSGGSFIINSGAGNDVITGGWSDDIIRTGSGNDTVHAGGGNDSINMGAFLTASDNIDGGAGTDTLYLNGDYSSTVTFGSTTVTNIESIVLSAGHSYSFILDIDTVTAGNTLTLHADTLGSSDNVTFDGSALAAGTTLILKSGDGNDTLLGGGGNDTIEAGNGTNVITGNGGADQLYGGTGVDTFVYTQVSDSTSSNFDRIHGFDASMDKIQILGVTVNAIDAEVGSGHLTMQNFDANMMAAIGSSQLLAHDAVLFTPDTGNLHGHTFLIVDMNGVAGYQAGLDLVIDITGASNLGSFSTADFLS